MVEVSDFQKKACALSLYNMLESKGHFDICAIRDIAGVLGVKLGGPDYAALSTLHCVDWGSMPKDFRDDVKRKCFEVLELVRPDMRNSDSSEGGSHIISRILGWAKQ